MANPALASNSPPNPGKGHTLVRVGFCSAGKILAEKGFR